MPKKDINYDANAAHQAAVDFSRSDLAQIEKGLKGLLRGKRLAQKEVLKGLEESDIDSLVVEIDDSLTQKPRSLDIEEETLTIKSSATSPIADLCFPLCALSNKTNPHQKL